MFPTLISSLSFFLPRKSVKGEGNDGPGGVHLEAPCVESKAFPLP